MTNSKPALASELRATRKPASGGASLFLMRTAGFVGKDLVRYWQFPLLLLLLVVLIICGYAYDYGLLMGKDPLVSLRIVAQYQEMLVMAAYIMGFVIIFEERESGAWTLFRLLPARPGSILFQKLASAVTLVAIYAILSGIVMSLYGSGDLSLLNKALFLSHEREFFAALPAVLLTGMVMPLILPPNLTVAALSGPAALSLYILGMSRLWGTPVFPMRRETGALAVSFGVWSVGMFVLLAHRLRHANLTLAEEIPFVRKVHVPDKRIGNAGFDWPSSHLMRYPFIAVLAVAAFLPLLPMLHVDLPPEPVLFLSPILGALFGCSAIAEEERHSALFYLYSLPITREAILWQRLRALLGRALIISCLMAADVSILQTWQKERVSQILVPGAFAGFISAALLSFLFCLFVRLKLFAVILVLVVEVFWVSALTICVYSLGLPTLATAEGVSYLLWVTLCVVGLPIAATYLGFCRSPLLAQSEGRRGLVALVAMLFFIVWGTTLILVSPYYLFIRLLG